MEVYIAKRADRYHEIGNLMSMAKRKMKKQKLEEKKRKKIIGSCYDYMNHLPDAKKMHQDILGEEFDIFDLL